MDTIQKRYRDLDSDLCGWYCLGLAFTVYRLYNHPNISLIQRTNNFINIFSSNTGENADILKNYFKNILNSPSLNIKEREMKIFQKKLFSKNNYIYICTLFL
jgi:hypothetical protein